MNSHVFMNGLNDEIFIMDDKVDPNLIKVLPDYMNNLNQRRYQQPEMRPDVIREEGLEFEYIPGTEWKPSQHPDGCQCPACRNRRRKDHVAIYEDISFMQNRERKFVIDLKAYAFDTQSTKDYNITSTMLRFANTKEIPVLSNKYYIRLLYTLISVDENGSIIKTQDGAIQSEANRHFYITTDQDAEGYWTYNFMDLHNTDVITVPTMYGSSDITLNIRGIEVYGRTTGYSLTVKDGSMIYVNTGIKDKLLFKDTFGVEYRGYAYNVLPHDRVRLNFSVVFNNISFVADITCMKDLYKGLDYRTCDFETVPSWNGIQLWSGTDVTDNNFINVSTAQFVQEAIDTRLSKIAVPKLEFKEEIKDAV